MKKIVGISKVVANNEVDKINEFWGRFLQSNIKSQLNNILSDDLYSIYTNYQGDYTQPYKLLLGYQVSLDSETPEGLDSVLIPDANYERDIVKGEMPLVVFSAWQKIWSNGRKRAYDLDYDRYLQDGSVEINVEYLD